MALGAGEERGRKSLELSRHKIRACEQCEAAFGSHQCPQVIVSSIPVSITQEKRVSRDGSVSTVLVMQAGGPCFKSPAAVYHRVKVCNLNAVCDRLLYPRPCLKDQRAE